MMVSTDLPTFKFRHVRLSVEKFSVWGRKIHDIHSQVWRFGLLGFSHGKGEEGKEAPNRADVWTEAAKSRDEISLRSRVFATIN